MMQLMATGHEFGTRKLRLETLVRLRWLAVAGQTVAVLVVFLGFGFPLPVGLCFLVIALSAWLNIFLKMRYAATHRLESTWGALLLSYDILQLAALLYLTGGLENPFSLLLLVPVMVSATILPPKKTIMLGILVIVIATVLAVFHQPLPWHAGETLSLPFYYVFGIWLALLCGLAFMSVYAWRVADEARNLADALAAAELVLAREQRLSALDGLAAAAAHELGTPLATIALVSREIERDLPDDSPLADDITLLRTQSERCRQILRKLSSLGAVGDEHFSRLPLSSLIEEVVEPHREFGIDIDIRLDGDRAMEPIGQRNPGILYGISNIVENAVDFAENQVEIIAAWDDDDVALTIADDGPGFRPEIINRIGDPYVTTRRRSANAGRPAPESGGLGLGFFIAKTLLERTGAQIDLSNRAYPGRGAVVQITWPRSVMDIRAGAPV